MKIIYIIDRLFPAGTQHHVCQLALGMNQAGHKVRILCLEDEGPLADSLRQAGITVTAFHTPAVYHPRSIIKLWTLSQNIRAFGPDVVQTFLLKAHLMGTIAARMAGVPVIMSSRRSMGYDFQRHHYLALRLMDRWISGTVVNSRAIEHHTQNAEGMSDNKLHVVYNGVDMDRFSPASTKSAHIIPTLPEDAFVVGVVANIRPVKGYEYLIGAAEKISSRFPDIHFLVVGNTGNHDSYHQQLLQQIETAHLTDRFHWIHDCSDSSNILQVMDIAVLPSVSEGFSNTILEYMASAKPVVATLVGGNAEAIESGINGLLVTPKDPEALADAISYLYLNPESRKQMALNGWKRTRETFSLQAMVQKYEQIYETYRGLSKNTEIHFKSNRLDSAISTITG
ncbi:MAG: glycosyltransferase [SAR324 cluster bacterium]|nr:glycosyltransferase [SAR324 cluster bacterium]